jgi:hypothetical protein
MKKIAAAKAETNRAAIHQAKPEKAALEAAMVTHLAQAVRAATLAT